MKHRSSLFVGFVGWLCLAVLVPAIAWADPRDHATPTCPSHQEAWVRSLAIDAATPIALHACPAGRMIVRLDADAGPLLVELVDGDGPAFAKVPPWRVSPMVEVDDFSMLPISQRSAFAKLIAVLPSRAPPIALPGVDSPISLPPSISSSPSRRLPWPLLLAGVCLVLSATSKSVSRRRQKIGAHPWLSLFAIVALALTLRYTLGSWGPFHVNGQGTLWLDAALRDPGQIEGYGPGYWELFHSLSAFGPRHADVALFALNGLVSALTPALVFVLARLWFLSWQASFAAALVVALDPVAIRVATTEAYHVPITFLVIATSVCVAWWGSSTHVGGDKNSRLFASLRLVAAGLIASQVARVHPMSWPLVALAPLAVLPALRTATHPKASRWSTVISLVAAMASVGAITLLLDANVIMRGITFARENEGTPASSHVYDALVASFTPAIAIFSMAIAWLVSRARPNGVRMLIVASASLLVMAFLRHGFRQSEIWSAAFDGLFTLPASIAIVAGVGSLSIVRRYREISIAALLLILVVRVASTPLGAAARTTDEHEYAWIRSWAFDSSKCDVAYVARAGQRTFFFPSYLLDNTNRIVMRIDPRDGSRPITPRRDRCLLYVRPALCSSDEGSALCNEVERSLSLERRSSAKLPARPSSSYLRYRGDPVEVVLFEALFQRPPLGRSSLVRPRARVSDRLMAERTFSISEAAEKHK